MGAVYAPVVVSAFHESWGWVAAGINGAVGVWGVFASFRDAEAPRAFYAAVGVAVASMLVQVVVGVGLLSGGDVEPGNQHVFYGVLIAVTFTFSYIYRVQLRKRPSLYYGLLLLFTMGLGIRGIMTFGVDF